MQTQAWLQIRNYRCSCKNAHTGVAANDSRGGADGVAAAPAAAGGGAGGGVEGRIKWLLAENPVLLFMKVGRLANSVFL